jgi:hypothetical protein
LNQAKFRLIGFFRDKFRIESKCTCFVEVSNQLFETTLGVDDMVVGGSIRHFQDFFMVMID